MTGSLPFWDYSLRLYSRPGTAEICLRLQDRLGADVTLLMFGLWVAAGGGGALSVTDWGRAIGATQAWRDEVVRPLRAIRKNMKGGAWPGVAAADAEALRTRIKTLELEAELAQHRALAATFPNILDTTVPVGDREADAVTTLSAYVLAARMQTDAADRAALAQSGLAIALR